MTETYVKFLINVDASMCVAVHFVYNWYQTMLSKRTASRNIIESK